MDNAVEFVKAWGALPIGLAMLAFMVIVVGFLYKFLDFFKAIKESSDQAVGNHLHTIQQNTEETKKGIVELSIYQQKTIQHMERQNDLLNQLVKK